MKLEPHYMTTLLALLVSFSSNAGTLSDIGREIASPVTTEAKYYLLGGSLLTGILVIDGIEDSLGHDIQNDTVEDKPLGKFSQLGDFAGQMIPNAIYAATLYGLSNYYDNPDYHKKSIHMLKSTAYTALATTVIKAIAREPRP
ncbi:MAG: hypothetical protein IT287_05635, partial [Bdellovibrionaceae bacterium]|nr:hypothetical protein [Pseudobdellovibrionaceae bacterium]